MNNFSQILFDIHEGIATITLNRPDIRNAISGLEMICEIEEACIAVNKSSDARVLIITGVDPAFSSGGNIKDISERKGIFHGTPAQVMENYKQTVHRIPLAIYGVKIPTIAAVNGPAIGAGCDLSLMCDIRFASCKAKFAESFINLGLISGDGGSWFLPKVVGLARACELTFTGDVIDSKKALEIGLVNYVTKHEDLMTETMALARKTALKSVTALKMAKHLMRSGQEDSLTFHLDQAASYQAICHFTDDHHKAMADLMNKTK